MKARLDHRRKTIAAAVLTGVALLLTGRLIFDSPHPRPSISVTTTQERAAQVSALPEKRTKRDDASLDPMLETQQLALAENRLYEGTGRNIFRSEHAPHQQSVVYPPKPTPPAPIPEHVAPAIALRFFGYGLLLNQPRKVFLAEGDSVFVANEGDIVNRRYRVLRIDSNAVVIEDLIEKSVHRLSLPG